MKSYISAFCKRGLLAAAGGPVILAIIYGIWSATGAVQALSPGEVCKGILTITLMAFIAGGITTIYQLESLPLFSALLIHGTVLYIDYIFIYLVNGWLKQQLVPILIFTAIFIAGYAFIWLIIYCIHKKAADGLNRKIQSKS